ncbi:MAG: S1/P1 Nuclease [Thermoflavifilum aggregans]|nr:S1/P1 Nuclease [Thermoflavifilum aggregans]
MRKSVITSSLIALMVCLGLFSLSWGIWGHQHINRAAVFALPDSMRVFFFNHIDYITEEAAVPDLRKYVIGDQSEPDRHYIDLEEFGDHPFDSLPQTWDAAVAKYGEKKLHKAGILPWYIEQMEQKLEQAFRSRRTDEILFIAADLGHYIADAHVPFHTTVNHDGQLTGQRGIHAFWESQLPELFGSQYNFHVAPAHYIPDIQAEVWKIIRHSHQLVDTALRVEKQLLDRFPKDELYRKDADGKIVKNKYGQPVFSYAFAKAYHEALHGMVEDQMRRAIQELADFWYTAWVNAGRPNLTVLDDPSLTEANQKIFKKAYRLWQQGKLWGIRSGSEY